MKFRVVIVTRDSAGWIGTIADAYRRLGLRPLYLVHDKTRDATAAILEKAGDEVRPITLAHDYVEAAVSQFPNFVGEDWVLRMDDDEFPSRRMIDFTQKVIGRTQEQAIVFPRREVLPHVTPLAYPTTEILYNAPLIPFLIDPQARAFRHREVAFSAEIHTPGFVPASVRLAPEDAHMVHFNTTVRSFAERLAKLARYEKQSPGAGTLTAARASLPEILLPEELRARPFETREFDDLARRLRAIPHDEAPETADPDVQARILAHFKQARAASSEELKLDVLRDRIASMPAWARAFFKLR